MSMEQIRKYRGVPAKRGMRVFFTGRGHDEPGRIKSARGGYLMIELDGDGFACSYHPTWKLRYLDEGGKVIFDSEAKQ